MVLTELLIQTHSISTTTLLWPRYSYEKPLIIEFQCLKFWRAEPIIPQQPYSISSTLIYTSSDETIARIFSPRSNIRTQTVYGIGTPLVQHLF